MTDKGFRVTVEDLENGERAVREIAPGDYILIPCAPCYRDGIQIYPRKGTHVITIKDYGPEWPPREPGDSDG